MHQDFTKVSRCGFVAMIDHLSPFRCQVMISSKGLWIVLANFIKGNCRPFTWIMNRANQAIDIANGGSKIFRKVRDTPPPPLNSVAWMEKVQVKRVAWPKAGLTRLPYIGTCNFKKHTPVTFQGQTVHIEDITPTIIQVDHPVKLRSADDLIITQNLISTDIGDMHQQLNYSWSNVAERPTGGPFKLLGRFCPICDLPGGLPHL